MKKNWQVLFSQTGSEIYEISKHIGRLPDLIITNKPVEEMDTINPMLFAAASDRMVFIPKKPNIMEYKAVLTLDALITLHGFLRVIPPEICSKYEIWNGHPGLILPEYYPQLKGKDPQKKAYDLGLELSGCVIHKVVPKVDAGEIVDYIKVDINKLSLDEVITKLHDASIDLWCKFLRNRL